jgi:hypothetical protein
MAVNRYYSSVAQDTTLTANIVSGAGSMVVGSTTGFPTSYPFTLAVDYDTATEELVSVTAAAGLTLTITRGIDGSSPQAHNIGAVVRHVISAQDVREPQNHMAASSGVHGVTGSVIGTSDYTAKGVILVGTTGSAKTPLTVGTNNYVLTADSAETSGVKWAAIPSPTPRIGQVVSVTSNTQTDTTSTSLVDCTGITASITPTLSTSKVLVSIDCDVQVDGNPASTIFGRVAIVKGSTVLTQSRTLFYNYNSTVNGTLIQRMSMSFLDSPATTSSTTYKLQMAAGSGTTMSTNAYGYYATVTLKEVLV